MSAVAGVRGLVQPPLACRSVSRTHVGRVRVFNEDRVLDDAEAGLWAVADGMGGHSGGDLAAQQIIDSLREAERAAPLTADGVTDALRRANEGIAARNDRLRLDAGATVVTAVLAGSALTIAWAGDSRAYRLRDGGAEQLTHDHSVVQQLVDAGLLNREAAERHPQANVVTRALGVDRTVALDSVTIERARGRFLLCSDGLSRSLCEAELSVRVPLDRLADTLIAGALARDGSDNVSLVLIDIG